MEDLHVPKFITGNKPKGRKRAADQEKMVATILNMWDRNESLKSLCIIKKSSSSWLNYMKVTNYEFPNISFWLN